MAALMAVLVQQAGDNGVLLRPLEHGGGVRLVQTRAAALLRRRQAIGWPAPPTQPPWQVMTSTR